MWKKDQRLQFGKNMKKAERSGGEEGKKKTRAVIGDILVF